jgi:hypothetical protein
VVSNFRNPEVTLGVLGERHLNIGVRLLACYQTGLLAAQLGPQCAPDLHDVIVTE